MLVKTTPAWFLPEHKATPEKIFWNRRDFSKRAAAGTLLGATGINLGKKLCVSTGYAAEGPLSNLFPAPTNDRYVLDRPLTPERLVTTYNNFFEFGSHKNVWKSAMQLPLRPWQLRLDGLVEKPITLGADELIRKMALEERLLRHRCVEAWSIAVPWTGFPLKSLVDMARPLSGAKYLKMTGFDLPDIAPGQRQTWLPWPYVEGLTINEAVNEMSMLVVGAYGKPLPHQNGAPLRLIVPWKYGFKSIKSIQQFTFTDERPVNFWQEIASKEYGFWANVNPQIPHPRWSQSTEKMLGSNERVPTQLYNGYGEFVAHLYEDLENESLYM